MTRASLRVGLGVLWALAVAWITLTPGGAAGTGSTDDLTFHLCLICGSRITGDAILNVVLFLPLGLLLGLRWPARVALLAGLSLSSTIELLQLSIDGRYSSIGDIAWNSLGAGLGALLIVRLRKWTVPGADASEARVVAVGLPVAYLLLAGIAIAPSGTDARYFGQWTADLAYMLEYDGTVLTATLDSTPIPKAGAFPSDSDPRALLTQDWTVEARVIVGRPPAGVSPIVSIHDGNRQEIFLLGVHGQDLMLRERTVGDHARLDRPDVRWWDALQGAQEGDTVTLRARRNGQDRCLMVNGTEQCGLGVTPGGTWGLLMFLDGAGEGERTFLSVAWMATLWFGLGLIGGRTQSIVRATTLGTVLTLGVVAFTRLLLPTPLEWVGMALGVTAGILLRPVIRAFTGPPPAQEAMSSS